MQIKPRSYPYPVLSHFGDDIVKSQFQPVVEVEGIKNAYSFKARFKTNNADLLALVAKKSAQYVVHVECAQTRYRNVFKSFDERFEFDIPAGLLDGRVEVCSFILAAKGLAKYKNANFHSDYASLSFNGRVGRHVGDRPGQGVYGREERRSSSQDPVDFLNRSAGR